MRRRRIGPGFALVVALPVVFALISQPRFVVGVAIMTFAVVTIARWIWRTHGPFSQQRGGRR